MESPDETSASYYLQFAPLPLFNFIMDTPQGASRFEFIKPSVKELRLTARDIPYEVRAEVYAISRAGTIPFTGFIAYSDVDHTVATGLTFMAYDFELPKDDAVSLLDELCHIYLAIQKSLIERPTVFRTETRKPQWNLPANRALPGRPRTVRALRVITLDPEYKEPTGRHMTCPAWGVIGHYRHCKSGKVVWIKPFTKGKQRNRPGAYSAKNYEIVQEA